MRQHSFYLKKKRILSQYDNDNKLRVYTREQWTEVTAGGIGLPTFTCNNSVTLLLNRYPESLIYLDESHAQANIEPTIHVSTVMVNK